MHEQSELSGFDDEIEVNVAHAIGASDEESIQILALYIPNRDQEGQELGDQPRWVREAATLLARMGGGVTVMPPVEGGWVDSQGAIIWEQPVIVYSYIKPDAFIGRLPELREFLHRMGRQTNQGEVAVEFDGNFYRIVQFDEGEGA